MMQLGILQCDSVPESMQPSFGDYPVMFQSLLTMTHEQPNYRIYNLTKNEFPESIHECDAWLVTGSRWSVNDDTHWIQRAHEFVYAIHIACLPLIGICFGHQMIARALGGKVTKAKRGWGVGLHTTRIIKSEPWMRPEQRQLSLLVSHQDQVVEPPSEARVLAGHDFCPFYMLQIGNHTLTIQGHPEFTPNYLKELIKMRRKLIGYERAQKALDSLESTQDSQIMATWIHSFIEFALNPDHKAK